MVSRLQLLHDYYHLLLPSSHIYDRAAEGLHGAGVFSSSQLWCPSR